MTTKLIKAFISLKIGFKCIFFVFFGTVVLIFSSCDRDMDLNSNVFIEDKDCPDLPIYSEWGYNSFGAYIDREPFISSYSELPGKIIIKKDTLQFYLIGKLHYQNFKIVFIFPNNPISDYQSLVSLNNQTLSLKSPGVVVKFVNYDNPSSITILDGSLQFKRVQKLYVDKVLNRCIVSGVFNFSYIYSGEPCSVTNGRFDIGIGTDNFYKL